MAHNISGASLTPIYNRLHGVSDYHPLDAETFADWSIEAGDIVKVSRDGTDYLSPVHTSTMTWRGKTPTVTINSTGKQHRDPPVKLSRQKYSRSGAGMRNNQILYYEITSEDGILHSAILMTESVLRVEFDNAISDVHSSIQETADSIRSEVYTSSSQVYSYIQQTASNIRQAVGDDIEGVYSAIEETADSIRSEVYTSSSQVYSYIQQTASNIVLAVGDAISDVHAEIETTAESIRSSVYASSSQIYSYIQQTASNIVLAVGDAISDVYSSIEETADAIRSSVYTSSSQVYSYIQQTASSIRSEVGNSISNVRTIISQTADQILLEVAKGAHVFHQYSDPSYTEEVKDGDIWVKDSGATTNGKAGNFTHGELGDFRYADFYGQEIYIRQNGVWEGPIGGSQAQEIARAHLEIAEDHIAIITDGMSGDYAEFIVEIGRIRSEVEDVQAGLESTIEQTASMIRSAVFTANSTMYSEIIQTQSMIRTEVYSSESRTYSQVEQTANSLSIEISHKRAQYIQLEDPSLTHTMYDGDLWIIDKNIYTHAALGMKTFAQLGAAQYLDFYGKETKVWKGGQWLPYYDERAQNLDKTRVDINENGISLLKGDLSEQYSQFVIEKNNIRSIVNDKINGVNTKITQTATEIRSEANASSSKIYSAISQTASRVMISVGNAIEDVYSEIDTTAGQIRSSVYSSSSQIYTFIKQTASQIRAQVGNDISGLQSSITAQANRISLVVEGTGSNAKIKPAEIVAAINATTGQSTALISADHVRISGNTKISDIFGVNQSGYVTVAGDIYENGVIHPTGVSLAAGGTIGFTVGSAPPVSVSLSGSDVQNMIIKAEVDGNNLKLWKRGDAASSPSITFSKATSLDGDWGGTVAAGKYYKVTASPQNVSFQSPQLDGITKRLDKAWATDKKSFTQTLYVYDEDGTELYEENLSFSTTDSYNAGFDANHSMFIGDENYNPQSSSISVTPGSPLELWAYFLKSDGQTYQWSSKYTISAVDRYNAGFDANHNLFLGDSNYVRAPVTISISPGNSIELWPYFLKSDGETYQWGPKYTFSASSPSIDIPAGQIYTSDRATGTKLTTLKTRYEQAKADGDYVMFRVDAGGTSKWYYMEP